MSDKISADRPNGWSSIKALIRRIESSDDDDTDQVDRVSVKDKDVPTWQRSGTAWSAEQRGMLALSIIQGYPIGIVYLWRKAEGTLVPIDGRQRLSAILGFAHGEVKIPNLPWVPEEYQGKYYPVKGKNIPKGERLSTEAAESFEEYTLDILVYPSTTKETVLMDIFVRLQGGTPLNKAEVRAALGTTIAKFVTGLVRTQTVTSEDEDAEEEVTGGHKFFKKLDIHYKNRRKSHRQVCDQLLNEFLCGDGSDEIKLDHHWESLTQLYRMRQLRASEETSFSRELTSFERDFRKKSGLSTALASPNLISTWFRVWRYFRHNYATEPRIPFASLSEEFEATRLEKKREEPYKSFKQAISSSGYTSEQNSERAAILQRWLLDRCPGLKLKDPQRLFTRDQKYVIWHRAGGRCEWKDDEKRCSIVIVSPVDGKWHADHVMRHGDGGPTSVENGQLLCAEHNLKKH